MSFIAPPFSDALFDKLLSLNNSHAEELSYKSPAAFRDLIAAARLVLAEPGGLALLVAFDEGSRYDNPNFAWLKARFERFTYIDRVVVDEKARGLGLARKLYDALAHAANTPRLVCEINTVPPNPASDAFHERLGFVPIGVQALANGKVVRYWERCS